MQRLHCVKFVSPLHGQCSVDREFTTEAKGGKAAAAAAAATTTDNTPPHTFTGRVGASLSLLQLQLHKPGVRTSAPSFAVSGHTAAFYNTRAQHEEAFRITADEQHCHASHMRGDGTAAALASGFSAFPTPVPLPAPTAALPFSHGAQPVTPAVSQRAIAAAAAAAASTAPRLTRTATTTLSGARPSGTSQGSGDCIMALIDNRASEVGVALCQLPSLAIIITQYGDSVAFTKTLSFVFSRNPVEVLVPETVVDGKFVQTLLRHFREITFTGVPRRSFDEAQGAHRLLELMSTDDACLEVGNTDRYLCVAAANALIQFMELTYNYTLLPHTVRVQYLTLENYMEVSRLSARALHLIATGPTSRGHTFSAPRGDALRGGGGRAARKTFFRAAREQPQSAPLLPLVEALNHTMTGVGRRLLRSTILQPLRDPTSIELRYDSVEWLRNKEGAVTALRRWLQCFGGDDFERALSSFSHEAKVQTLKTMQQRIESVVVLWQRLGSAIQLAAALREVLGGDDDGDANNNDNEGAMDMSEQKDPGFYHSRSGDNSDDNDADNDHDVDKDNSGNYVGGDDDDKNRSPEAFELRRKRRRCSENARNSPRGQRERKRRIFTKTHHQHSATTLLRKLLEALTVCRMDEISAEIGVYLDEGIVRATRSKGAQAGGAAGHRVRRPGSAVLQVQQCFAVKPNLCGTLDASRYQYSQAVEAMFAHAEELKQRHGVGSLRVVYDIVRGYHLSYDARHECNAPDSIFLQKYSGGNHYALYHSSCMTMIREGEENGGEISTNTPECGDQAHALVTDSTYPVGNEFSAVRMQQQQHQPFSSSPIVTTTANDQQGDDRTHHLTKHQLRGKRVTCTTKELLVLRRTADEAVAEILHTQDGLVRFLIEYLRQRLGKLQVVCDAVAMLDLLVAFATYSRLNACTRPTLLKPDRPLGGCSGTYFVEARHPGGLATANTIRWDGNTNVLLITGPNAAGKTTLLRQLGQMFALAQSGCLVPARAVALQPCDRLIAHMLCDDLEDTTTSSFGKEMRELSYLCLHATRESVVLVDELGRRTAVREGTAIAWATVEFLVETRCRTVFVTHFSRLTRLEGLSAGSVKNYHLAVSTGDEKNSNEMAGGAGSVATRASVKTTSKSTCALRFEYRLLPGPSEVDHYGLRLAERVGFFAPALALAKELLPLMGAIGEVRHGGSTDDTTAPGYNGGRDDEQSTTAVDCNCSSTSSRNSSRVKQENKSDSDTLNTAPRLSGTYCVSTISGESEEPVSSDSLRRYSQAL
ncbi:mismatch repair protein MSH4 [Trypanosoma grayi]|uniref:mismatch repair protein MSH4 n=1 Tax=Trypanosoma grayi TaxID=71804 RepID=UPI0004F446C4|nr:mismatch repair protein MSH4 [Trypanosoma grayi]KEG09828.1 mismatch repair protein MSH4 [Trypanosoma grayi]